MTAPDDFETAARELLTVRLDDKPEGATVREALYFQIRDALRVAYARGLAAGAAQERERCAKACRDHALRYPRERGWDDINGAHRTAARAIEDSIRARGQSGGDHG